MILFSRKGVCRVAAGLIAFCSTYIAGAQHDLNQPLTKQEDKADSMYYEAVKARVLDDDKQAKLLLQKVIDIKPNEAAPYYDLARLYLKEKNVAKAKELAKKATTLDGKNKWYRDQYAFILGLDNQVEEAANTYAQLAREEKHNNDYLLKASMLYQRAGKNKEALDILDKLTETTGDNESFLLQKQQIYLKMNDLDNATKIAQQLIDNNPTDGRYYVLLAELYENNKQPQKAFEIFTRAQKLLPDDADIQYGVAEYYRRTNDTAKYNEYLKKLVTNKELDAEAQMGMLIELVQQAGEDSVKRKEAVTLAGRLAELHQENSQVQDIYGQVLIMNGRSEEAAAQFKRSLAIDQSHFDVWQRLLSVYTAKKDADSLIYYSQKAIRLFPNQALAHFLNGLGYVNKKETTKAANSINRAIDLLQDDNPALQAEMYSTLGDLYYMDKQYALSDSCYSKAMKLQPEDATILNNYSYYLSERGVRLEDAERMSKRSLELRPDEPSYLDTYGWILFKMGKFEKAKEYIERAVAANRGNADGTLYEHLGDVYYKLNEPDKAYEYWKKSKEKGNDSPLLDKKIKDRKFYE